MAVECNQPSLLYRPGGVGGIGRMGEVPLSIAQQGRRPGCPWRVRIGRMSAGNDAWRRSGSASAYGRRASDRDRGGVAMADVERGDRRWRKKAGAEGRGERMGLGAARGVVLRGVTAGTMAAVSAGGGRVMAASPAAVAAAASGPVAAPGSVAAQVSDPAVAPVAIPVVAVVGSAAAHGPASVEGSGAVSEVRCGDPASALGDGWVAAPEWLVAKRYEIAAGPLGAVLKEFERQSGLRVKVSLSSAAMAGFGSAGLRGEYRPKEALGRLLDGTGLTSAVVEEGRWRWGYRGRTRRR